MPAIPPFGQDPWGEDLVEFLYVSHREDGRIFVENDADTSGAGDVPGLKISVGDGSPLNPSANDFVALYAHIQSSADRERVWAANPIVEVLTGLDAEAIGLEVNVNNDGSDVATVSTTNQKVGITAVSGNHTNPATVAYSVDSSRAGGGGWHHGLHISGVIDNAIRISDNAVGGTLFPTIGVSIGNHSGGLAGPIVAEQFANGGDTVVLQRSTNTTPAGAFLRCLNADNSLELFILGIDGSVITRGNLSVNPSGTDVFVVDTAGRIRINQVAVAAVPATQNKRFPIYDASGVLQGYVPVYN